MPKFLVILRQKGEGCGYGIGCGVRLEIVEAENVTAAADQLRIDWTSEDAPGYLGLDAYQEGEIDAAWIVPMTEALAIPFRQWAAVEREKRARQASQDEEQRARALLGDLKARFES